MKTPCCKKTIKEDDIWNLIEGNDSGVTNKLIICPYCNKNLIVYLDIDSLEVEE